MFEATLGGLLIGFSALTLMFFYGRIAGVSGIFLAGIEKLHKPKESTSSLAFITGLILGSSFYYIFTQQSFPLPENSFSLAIMAGLLVGFGTRTGSGCTSGHGVCGISRFSLRSLSATFTFILFGMLTVGIIRHVL